MIEIVLIAAAAIVARVIFNPRQWLHGARPRGEPIWPAAKHPLSGKTRMGLFGAHIDQAGGIDGKRR